MISTISILFLGVFPGKGDVIPLTEPIGKKEEAFQTLFDQKEIFQTEGLDVLPEKEKFCPYLTDTSTWTKEKCQLCEENCQIELTQP